MKKAILLNGLKYGLGLALVVYVVWKNWAPEGREGLNSVWLQYVVEGKPINWGLLAAAFAICTVSTLLTFVRWYILVRAQQLPFTLPNAFRLGMIGYFLNNFVPGAIGGDIFKAAFIAREQSRRTVAVATVLIDRAVGLWGLFWVVALFGGAFWSLGIFPSDGEATLKVIIVSAVGLVVGSLCCWFLLGVLPAWRAERFAGRLERLPRVGHALSELWRAVWLYRCRGGTIAIAVLMSIVGHIGSVVAFYFAALTLRPASQLPNLATHFLIVPIGMVFQAGFPAPGGLGGGELMFGKLYQLVHQPEGNGVLAALVQRLITWLLGFIGYITYLRMRPALVQEAALADSEAGDDQCCRKEIGSEARPQLIADAE